MQRYVKLGAIQRDCGFCVPAAAYISMYVVKRMCGAAHGGVFFVCRGGERIGKQGCLFLSVGKTPVFMRVWMGSKINGSDFEIRAINFKIQATNFLPLENPTGKYLVSADIIRLYNKTLFKSVPN